MLRLSMRCARLAVVNEPYERLLAVGVADILRTDAGTGVVTWRGAVEDPDFRVDVQMAAAEPLPSATLAAAITVVHRHPTFDRSLGFAGPTHRVSDEVFMPAFWDTDVWRYMHGHANGRYPASALLGRHQATTTFVGVHRTRRDFDADDMVVLDCVREPLSSALAFRAAWQDAAIRCRSGCAAPTGPLTAREEQVIGLVALGWTNAHIGRHLRITERTVRKHLENVYDKLGTPNRAAAVDRWRSDAGHGNRLARPSPFPAAEA